MKYLRRCAALVWLLWFLTVALILGQHHLRVVHFAFVPFAVFVFWTSAAVLTAGWLAVRSWRRAGHRRSALVWLGLAVLPVLLFILPCVYAGRLAVIPSHPNNVVFQFASGALASTLEGYVGWAYPNRLETERLIMFYDELDAPEHDAAMMDRYVAQLEERSGRPLRAKIYWVRGPLLGIRYTAFRGFALGTSSSPDWESTSGNDLDRHELAHAVIEQYREPAADPPLFLDEGWAVSQSRAESTSLDEYYALSLAMPLSDQQKVEDVPRLPELVSREWYHNDVRRIQIHHRVGGPLVAYLIREYGIDRFLLLYNTCRQETFDADCQRVLGTDLWTLDRLFWEDIERTVKAARLKHQLP